MMTQAIQNIALFTAIFASGMLVGYLLKVVLMNKDKCTRGDSSQ